MAKNSLHAIKESPIQRKIWKRWAGATVDMEVAQSMVMRLFEVYHPRGRRLTMEEVLEVVDMFLEWSTSYAQLSEENTPVLLMNDFLLWLQVMDKTVTQTMTVDSAADQSSQGFVHSQLFRGDSWI
jgi:hypothetical protein